MSYSNDDKNAEQMEKAKKAFVVTVLEDYGDGVDARTFDTFEEASRYAQGNPKAMAIYKRSHVTVNRIEESK